MNNNIRYPEICKSDKYIVPIAYIPYPGLFEIVNNTMVEWYDFYNLLTDYSMILFDFEILKPFIQNNNIIVNWTANTTFQVNN